MRGIEPRIPLLYRAITSVTQLSSARVLQGQCVRDHIFPKGALGVFGYLEHRADRLQRSALLLSTRADVSSRASFGGHRVTGSAPLFAAVPA